MNNENVGLFLNRNTLVKKIMLYEDRLRIIELSRYTKKELEGLGSEELYRIFRMIDYWNSQVK